MPRGRDFEPERRNAFRQLLIKLRGTRTQTQVAQEAGVTQTAVSMMEKAPSPNLSIIDLAALIRYYGLTPNKAFEVLGLYNPEEHPLPDTEWYEARGLLRSLASEHRKIIYAAIRGIKEYPPTNHG